MPFPPVMGRERRFKVVPWAIASASMRKDAITVTATLALSRGAHATAFTVCGTIWPSVSIWQF